jgi:hypothetical protein
MGQGDRQDHYIHQSYCVFLRCGPLVARVVGLRVASLVSRQEVISVVSQFLKVTIYWRTILSLVISKLYDLGLWKHETSGLRSTVEHW